MKYLIVFLVLLAEVIAYSNQFINGRTLFAKKGKKFKI
jgi:hypothetical protein